VSIVTPVYQMARFISDTLDSVINQDYPRIEYIVMDGGSTDGTLDILRAYEGKVRENVTFQWFSRKDGGTADAINKGLACARGSIFAYINADDFYAKGAVSAAVESLIADPSAQAVYGEADWVSETGGVIGRYPTREFDAQLLRSECFICQPASFIRQEALNEVGPFNVSLRYAYDYEFWIRLSKRFRLVKLNKLLAASRMHANNKTLSQRRYVLEENITVQKRHYGYAPFSSILAYSAHLLDGRDQFVLPFQPSIGKYMLSLALGLRFNFLHPWRYAKEWVSVMSFAALRRQLKPRREV
jgi:glycosyltransferase involved in cell wall biosynthesis